MKGALGGTGIVSGSSVFIFREGIAEVEGTIFTESPGKKDVRFEIQSDALDMDKLKQVFGQDYR